MSKKIAIILIALILIAITVVGLYMVNKEEVVTLDLASLNIQMTETSEFDQMATADVDSEIIQSLLGIDSSLITTVVGKMPMINVQASMYIVIEATEGNSESVFSKVQEYSLSLEKQWKNYLPEQYDLVMDRKEGIIGNYVYLIIGEHSQELVDLMK